MKTFFFFLAGWFLAVCSLAQPVSKNRVAGPVSAAKSASRPDSGRVVIAIRGKVSGDSVALRWAPNRPGAWVLLNQAGYWLERRENTGLGSGAWTRVSAAPIKPRPLADWQRFANPPQTHPLTAAQAIYGKTFLATQPGSILEKADELTNRYSFALLAADLSPETALFAGLGWTDRGLRNQTSYEYRIYPARSVSPYARIDTGYVVVRTGVVRSELPPVIGRVEEMEKRVTLYWDKRLYAGLYSAYYIERSADQKTYRRLNAVPYVNMQSEETKDGDSFRYSDSLTENYRPYSYRLVGVDAFGFVSKPSESVRAMGRDKTPPRVPFNLSVKSLGGQRVELTWAAGSEPDLKGFLIARSTKDPLSEYVPLTPAPLQPGQRRFIDESAAMHLTNYYIVAAADTANNASASLAKHITLIDSIPPAAPVGLTGRIDTNGVVTIRWQPNREPDVQGYLLLCANDPTHLYTAVVNKPILDTAFVDTLQLRTLTRKIYYKLVAIDRNHNRSKESAVLVLTKPDRIPPVPPQWEGYQVDADKISLTWIASTSTDVVKHVVLRKKTGTSLWQPIGELPPISRTAFVDQYYEPATTYDYAMVAWDESGLTSAYSTPLRIKTPDTRKAPSVSTLKASWNASPQSIKLSWSYEEPTPLNCVLYRAVDGGKFQTARSFNAPASNYTDAGVKPGTTYEYTARIFYADGRISAFAPIVKVTTPTN